MFDESIVSLLECIPLAAVVVDSSRSIRAANRAAWEILMRGDGLHMDVHDQMHLNCQTLDDEFGELLDFDAAGTVKQVLSVPRTRDRLPWLLQVKPLGPQRTSTRSCMVSWLDPRVPPAADCSLLGAAFGLTAAEVRVAAHLATGDELGLVAGKLGIQQDTVRTHLKSTFRKMDIHRQQDLVRVVTMLSFLC